MTESDPPAPERRRYWETTITLRAVVEAPTAATAFRALRELVGLPVETGGFVVACTTSETFPEVVARHNSIPLLALD